MTSPVQRSCTIDIKATVEKYHAIAPSLLAERALSGCDTLSTYFGTGKGTVLEILNAASAWLLNNARKSQRPSLRSSPPVHKAHSDLLQQNNWKWYVRDPLKVRVAKFGNTASSASPIQSPLPSSEAFTDNVKRAHLQTCIWKAAVLLDPPDLDPLKYGCLKHEPSKSLLPVTLPAGVALDLDQIMFRIRCNCSEGTRRCRTMRCSCCRTRLLCTERWLPTWTHPYSY